jgi:glyoxylase-like metal-dependent hydrolase (beta-lactamase superfamily II)
MGSYADGWFQSRSMGDGVTLFWEARIKPDYRCNIWHVRGRDRDMLVDTGFGLVSLLDSIPELNECAVLAVGSHSHCDHVGGHFEFDHRHIHAAEADIMARPTRLNTVADPYVVDEMFEGAKPVGFSAAAYEVKAAPATRKLVEGDVVDLGDRAFEVLHIPGHSPGSIALYEKKTGIMFSGDVVHNGTNGIGKLILYHTVEDDFLTSVERLRKVPVSVVHGGHYASFGRDRYVEIIDDYIARKRSPGCPSEARMAKKV